METDYIAAALYHACYGGQIELVKQILDYKGNETAEFIDYEQSFGDTALIAAAVKGYLSIVKLLVEYGSDRSITDKNDHSALAMAKRMGHTDIVEYLQGLE